MVDFLDFYCERTAPGFWNEPFNAISNLAFVAVGFWGLRTWRADRRQNPWLAAGSVLVLLTGGGSFLFHTFANSWSHWADLLPILMFMLTAVTFSLRRAAKFSVASSARFVAAFMAVTLGIELGPLRTAINGSGLYVPTLILLGILGWRWTPASVAPQYRAAFGVFFLSLTARSVDSAFCLTLPIGTHFLWHGLNAIVLGRLLNVMRRLGASGS